jgi:hypothetical protein
VTLPASGQISMSQVSVELGRASNYASSLGESAVRTLAGVASGAISFSNLHGKSNYSLTNPTPGGFAEMNGFWPGSALAWVRAHPDGVLRDQDNNYTQFGSLWATSIAASKYWRWNYASGSSPNYTNMTGGTWYPVNDSYYVGQSRSSTGAQSGYVTIQFANDSGGGGATTGGSWSIAAIVTFE